MIKLSNITLPVDYNDNTILSEAAKQLKINKKEIADFEMLRLSVDARKKNKVHYTATVGITLKGGSAKENEIIKKNKKLSLQTVKPYTYYVKNIKKPSLPPVVVGAGPAGLFCGLVLAQAGACPVIIERGKEVEQRQKDVESFWKTGKLNENSNVQFGEGGAGTFS
ncbi:MAG: FAD-dependent monooxygenase, partial [Oscillospiraceae bacterium]|nr:FAD-dependent monooxygenase [Oscillospiraceae bacterium]